MWLRSTSAKSALLPFTQFQAASGQDMSVQRMLVQSTPVQTTSVQTALPKTLRVKAISYRHILKDISFEIKQGEIVALMGPNGSGKSTLARVLMGLKRQDSGSVEIIDDAGRIYPLNGPDAWQYINWVGQHPRRQTIGATIADELAFGLINKGLSPKQVREKVQDLVRAMGLQGKENQSPSTLSGGERQRLVTAAVLGLEPSFLILDEGLTMLDMNAQRRVLQLLFEVRPVMGQLWITHDPQLALLANRLLLMKHGTLYEAGIPEVALANEELCRKYMIIRHDLPGCVKADLESVRMSSTAQVTGMKLEKQPKDFLAQPPKSASDEKEKEILLEWHNASFGTRLVVNKVVRKGEFIGILGASGAGKTTLLESVIGLNLPDHGEFRYAGEQVTERNLEMVQRHAKLLIQEAGEYMIGQTVWEEVFFHERTLERQGRGTSKLTDWRLGQWISSLFTGKRFTMEATTQEKMDYLKRFGIWELADKAPERLSGGEKQRVAWAALLRVRPEVVLLDEPKLGLDAEGRAMVDDYLAALRGKTTILYVSHDLADVVCADRIWLIRNGRIVLDVDAYAWETHVEEFAEAGVRCPGVNPFERKFRMKSMLAISPGETRCPDVNSVDRGARAYD